MKSAPPPTVIPTFVKPRKAFRYRWGLLVVLLLLSSLLFGAAKLSALTLSITGNGVNGHTSVFTQISRLIASRDRPVSGETRDRINVLLLGIGGPGHDGPLLADTIILASIKPSTDQVSLLSIPRDLAVDIPRYGIRKINNANAFGRDMKYPGGGEQLTADIVAEITGEPIDYYARVDFGAFRELVDTVGGIDITVDTAFSDNEYPDERHGYRPIRFTAGTQHMDGARALEFSRSRHGTNGEGSDFSRAARQQKVLVSLRAKTLSLSTLLNPNRIVSILQTLSDHAQTNLEPWEVLRLATLLKNVPGGAIATHVLDSSPAGPLKVATGLDGAFLLVTRADDWRDVRSIAQNVFVSGFIADERATVVIENASGTLGLAEAEGHSLSVLDYNIVRTGNAPVRTPGENILVDFTGGKKPNTVAALAGRYQAVVTTAAPASFSSADRAYSISGADGRTEGLADILLILGRATPSVQTTPTFL
jgi:LCP family protein required for cell wall assembly